MTFEQVLAWCRANGADVRGVYRGKDVSISHTDERLPGKNGDWQAYDRRFQEYTEGSRLTLLSSNPPTSVPTRLAGALEPVPKSKNLSQFFGALL
jgi:hypothetical protein